MYQAFLKPVPPMDKQVLALKPGQSFALIYLNRSGQATPAVQATFTSPA
jgi:hypothetical protein